MMAGPIALVPDASALARARADESRNLPKVWGGASGEGMREPPRPRPERT